MQSVCPEGLLTRAAGDIRWGQRTPICRGPGCCVPFAGSSPFVQPQHLLLAEGVVGTAQKMPKAAG